MSVRIYALLNIFFILLMSCSSTEPTPAPTIPTAANAAPSTATPPPTEAVIPKDSGCSKELEQVEAIHIGVVLPLSAPGSVTGGQAMQTALDIALEEINMDGGILGKPVQLIIRDSAGTPEIGKNVSEQLIWEECVVAIIGGYHSAVGLEVMEVSHEYGIPTIFSETYNDDITAKGYPEIFRIAPTSTFVAQMDALWLSEVGDYNGDEQQFVVIIAEDTDFGTGQVARAETWFPEFGIDLQVFFTNPSAENFDDIITNLQTLDIVPDAILVKVTGETSLRLQEEIVRAELAPNNMTMLIGNQVSLDHEAFWQAIPNGTYTIVPRIGPWPPTVSRRGGAFADQYAIVAERWPEAYAFEAYDSLYLIVDAIERAGSLDAEGIIGALESTDIELAAGHYYFEYGSQNELGEDVPAFMWHQWIEVPLLFLQYTEPNQHSSDMVVIWPDTYRTSEEAIVRPPEPEEEN